MKNWNPEHYDKSSIMQYRTAMAMLETLSLNGNEVILDVGSGSGKVTNAIAKRVPKGRVVGVDVAENMVNFARDTYKSHNLHFAKCDVVNMKYHNQFDVVVSFWTLSWVAHQRAALMNIVRSLKENGRMLLMYPMRHDVYDVIDNIIKRPEWKKYFQEFNGPPRPFFSEEKYRALLNELKLETLNVQSKQLECKFQDKEEMMFSITSWCPYLDKIQNEVEKQHFVEVIADEYLRFKNAISPLMHFSILEIRGLTPSLKKGLEINHTEEDLTSYSTVTAKL